MKRLAVAYFWLVSVALVFSVLIWLTWRLVDPWAEFWPVLIVVELLIHIRALFAADEFFQRRLGVHRPSISASGPGRSVAVNVFESAFSFGKTNSGQQSFQVEVGDLPSSFSVDSVVLSSFQVNEFLSRAWSRQRAGSSGLSRSYWLRSHRPTWDRSEYDAVLVLLDSVGLISGRRARASGKLVYPPDACKKVLTGKYGSPS